MRNLLAVSLLAAAAAWAQDQPVAQTSAPPSTQAEQPPSPAQPQAAPQQAPATQQTQPTEITPAPAQTPMAQQQPAIRRTNLTELFHGPTLSEVYCAGFISKEKLKASGTMVAGNHSPDQAQYTENGYIFLTGNDLQEGREYLLLRHTYDPNQYQSFPGQLGILRNLGELYQDLGRAKVLYIRNKTAVAHIESSCSDAMPGDIAVPFQERP